MMEREVTISEPELELLIEAVETLEKKCKTNAKLCMSGYGKVSSYEKRDAYNAKAKQLRELISRIAYEFI